MVAAWATCFLVFATVMTSHGTAPQPACPIAAADDAAALLNQLKCVASDTADADAIHAGAIAHYCAAILTNSTRVKLGEYASAAQAFSDSEHSASVALSLERVVLRASILEESAQLISSTDLGSRMARLRREAADMAADMGSFGAGSKLESLTAVGFGNCHLAAAKAYLEVEGCEEQALTHARLVATTAGGTQQHTLELAADAADLFIDTKGGATVSLARHFLSLPGAREHVRLLHVLSYLFKNNWHMNEMGQALAAKLQLQRRVMTHQEAVEAGKLRVPRELHVIEHDAEQFEYLASRGVEARRMTQLGASYRTVLATMQGEGEGAGLTRDVFLDVQSTMNRLVHLAHTTRIPDGALNTAVDWKGMERSYLKAEDNVVVVDDLLTPEALREIRRFCLESTIWFDARSRYLGAYHVEGFSTPLLWQIGEELTQMMPDVFKDYELTTFWAYKYGAFDEGIRTHADAAYVNVNFWITPSEANLDPHSGGLVVFKRGAPESWDFNMYNNGEGEAARTAFVQDAENVTVPHRQNRAVIFNSNLFHRTDKTKFKSGYKNRRINITFLYGKRKGSQTTDNVQASKTNKQ